MTTQNFNAYIFLFIIFETLEVLNLAMIPNIVEPQKTKYSFYLAHMLLSNHFEQQVFSI